MKQTTKLEAGMIRAFHMEDSVLCGIVLEREEAGYKILTVGGVKKTVANDGILSITISEVSEINAAILKEYFDAYQIYEDGVEQMTKAKKLKDFGRAKMNEAANNLRPERLEPMVCFCRTYGVDYKSYGAFIAKLKQEKLFLNPVKYCKEAGMDIKGYEKFMAEFQTAARTIFDEKVAGAPSGVFFPVDELLSDVEGEQVQLFVIQQLKKMGVEFRENGTLWRY